MITTDDDRLAARARLLRAHGMTATSWDRRQGRATGYDVIARGFNYRPSELEAALGQVQLAKLPLLTRRRRELVGRYRDAIEATGAGTVPFTREEDATSACHILPLVADDPVARERPARRPNAAACRRASTAPVHRFAIFAPGEPLPVTESFAEREVTLPLYPDMRDSDVDRVVEALPRAVAP